MIRPAAFLSVQVGVSIGIGVYFNSFFVMFYTAMVLGSLPLLLIWASRSPKWSMTIGCAACTLSLHFGSIFGKLLDSNASLVVSLALGLPLWIVTILIFQEEKLRKRAEPH